MSVDDLHAFFKKLEGDEDLRQEVVALEASPGDEGFAALQALAAREGYEVTEDDWKHESVGPAVASLSDDALRDVVAAAGCVPWGAYGSGGAIASGCDQSVGAFGGSGCGGSVGWGASGCGGSVGANAGSCG